MDSKADFGALGADCRGTKWVYKRPSGPPKSLIITIIHSFIITTIIHTTIQLLLQWFQSLFQLLHSNTLSIYFSSNQLTHFKMYSNIIAIFALAATVANAAPAPINNPFGSQSTIDVVKKCSPKQALACCNEAEQSCSPLALSKPPSQSPPAPSSRTSPLTYKPVQLLPIGQACGNGNNVQCCDIENFVSSHRLLSILRSFY